MTTGCSASRPPAEAVERRHRAELGQAARAAARAPVEAVVRSEDRAAALALVELRVGGRVPLAHAHAPCPRVCRVLVGLDRVEAAASAKPEGGGMSGPGTPNGRAPKPLPRASMRTW